MVLSTFSCACWLFAYLLRSVYSSPLLVFKSGFLYFCCWVVGVLYIFWILDPFEIYVCKYFLPFCGFSFYFFSSFLSGPKVFNFDEVQFIYFFFCFLCFWGQICDSIANLLSAFHLPGTRDNVVNNTDLVPALMEFTSSGAGKILI